MAHDPMDDRREYDEPHQLPILLPVTCGICGKNYDIDLTGFGLEYKEKFGAQMAEAKPWCDECKDKEWSRQSTLCEDDEL